MLPTLLLIAVIPGDHPRTCERTATEQVRVLAELTSTQAEQLEGRRARFFVQPCSIGEEDGFITCECLGLVGDAYLTLYFYPDRPDAVPKRVVVEAVLKVIRHPKTKSSPGFTEFRLTHGRLVR